MRSTWSRISRRRSSRNVRNGQPVEIEIDSFHGTRLRGHVDSLSPASGLEFALLPPDNATGNFTKIVQRVPVKIVLDDQRLKGLLRPGMSAVPTVDTKATVLAERETQARLVSDAAVTRPKGGKGSCPAKIINPQLDNPSTHSPDYRNKPPNASSICPSKRSRR